MYLGRLEPEFAFAMMATVIVASACTGWVWLAGRELAGEDRHRWWRAILQNTPALAVAGADVVMLLICITLPRTPLLVQYTTSHNQAHWQAWGWWFMIGGLLLQPVATAVALAGACRNWRGLPWKAPLAMRASTVLAAVVTWLGTMMNMPDA